MKGKKCKRERKKEGEGKKARERGREQNGKTKNKAEIECEYTNGIPDRGRVPSHAAGCRQGTARGDPQGGLCMDEHDMGMPRQWTVVTINRSSHAKCVNLQT